MPLRPGSPPTPGGEGRRPGPVHSTLPSTGRAGRLPGTARPPPSGGRRGAGTPVDTTLPWPLAERGGGAGSGQRPGGGASPPSAARRAAGRPVRPHPTGGGFFPGSPPNPCTAARAWKPPPFRPWGPQEPSPLARKRMMSSRLVCSVTNWAGICWRRTRASAP